MNDAEMVRICQYVANLNCDADRMFGREATVASQTIGERDSFDKLHHDEVTAVRKISRIENHCCVRMVQSGHCASFAEETIGYVAIAGKFGLDNFDGYRSFQSQMDRAIDRTHPASSDLIFDSESTGNDLRDGHT